MLCYPVATIKLCLVYTIKTGLSSDKTAFCNFPFTKHFLRKTAHCTHIAAVGNAIDYVHCIKQTSQLSAAILKKELKAVAKLKKTEYNIHRLYAKEKVTMELKGRFECYKTANGYFNYRLKASNNETIAVSGSTGYSTASNCKTGIEAMKKWVNSPIEDTTLRKPQELPNPKFQLYQDKEGKFRYRLFASNGELVCRCEEGYATKDTCKKGIASLAKWAVNADIIKAY